MSKMIKEKNSKKERFTLLEENNVIVEIENDNDNDNISNISTDTNNKNGFENINQIIEYKQYFEKNVTFSTKRLPSDDYLVISLVKIQNFRMFLDEKQEYESEAFDFYLPRFDINLKGKITIFPSEESFSIKVTFTDIINKLEENSPNSTQYDFFAENSNKRLNKNRKYNNDNDSYNILFSEKVQKIFSENDDVSFDLTYGIYNRARNSFFKSKKERIKLKLNNTSFVENYYDYDSLCYDKLVDPFIFRIRIIAAGINPEKSEDFVGLVNEGNTCYMNSLLQVIYHIKLIRKAVYNIPSTEDSLIYAFQKVFYSLQDNSSSVKVLDLFRALKWEKAFWNSQQDAQEIFSVIFNILSETDKNLLDGKIEDHCEGVVTTNIKCVHSDYESKKDEKFLFLQLDIENHSNLIECIEAFLSVENLIGENKFETDDKVKHDATKSFTFKKVPQILFVHLKRFRYNANATELIKLHSKLEYPNEVDLSSYINDKLDGIIYTLYATIVHDGTSNFGHYYVFIRNFLKGQWIKFNDSSVTIANDDEVFVKNFGLQEEEFEITDDGEILSIQKENERTAYILIYVQKDKIGEIFKELKKEDIPEALLQLINPKKDTSVSSSSSPIMYSTFNSKQKSNLSNVSYKNIDSMASMRDKANARLSYMNIEIENINLDGIYQSQGIKNSKKIKNEDRIENQDSKNNKTKKVTPRTSTMKSSTYFSYLSDHFEKNTNKINNIENIHNENPITENFNNFTPAKEKSQSESTNLTNSNSKSIRSGLSHFIHKNTKYLFTLIYYDNFTGEYITQISISRSFSTKTLVVAFMADCYNLVEDKTFDLTDIKMVILNKMGIFVRFVGDEDHIETTLFKHFLREEFICFYVFKIDDVLALGSSEEGYLFAAHMVGDKFYENTEEIDIFSGKMIYRPPLILKVSDEVQNEFEVRNQINRKLMKIYKEVTNQNCQSIKYNVMSSCENNANSYKELKFSTNFNYNDFAKMKCKGILTDPVMNIILESKYFPQLKK